MAKRTDWPTHLGKLVGEAMAFATRAWMLMFVAAVVAKRFEVFAAIGFMESLAWTAAYGLLRGLWRRDLGEGDDE